MEKEKRVTRNMIICLGALGIVGLILYMIPYVSTGIMNNDELLGRYWSFQGFKEFFKHHYYELLYDKGRGMSCLTVPILHFLEYFGKCTYLMKIIQMLVVISNVVLFGIIVKQIFNEKWLAVLVSILLVLFLPISFEPTLPNAYTTAYGISLSFIYGSIALYMMYLRKGKRKFIISSMILLYIACCSYEAFVTYVPIYFIICIKEKKIMNWNSLKENFTSCMLPIGVGCFFLVCYLAMSKVFPSQYSGNHMSFKISEALVIIKELFLKSLPGGLLLSDKYRFLARYYIDNLSVMGGVRIVCVLIIMGVSIYQIFLKIQTKKKDQQNGLMHLVVVLVVIICSLLPTLPIAVSEMYQGNVGDNGFVALPVTYFSYYFTTLAVGYIIFNIVRWKKCRIIQSVFVFAILMLGAVIQIENEEFSKAMNSDYNRLQNIEDIFQTNMIRAFDGAVLQSEDIFETRNTLAIHDSYWSDFSALFGLNMEIIREEVAPSSDYMIFETNDSVFSIVNGNTSEVLVFSKNELNKPEAIKVGNDQYSLFQDFDTVQCDNNYNIYSFHK